MVLVKIKVWNIWDHVPKLYMIPILKIILQYVMLIHKYSIGRNCWISDLYNLSVTLGNIFVKQLVTIWTLSLWMFCLNTILIFTTFCIFVREVIFLFSVFLLNNNHFLTLLFILWGFEFELCPQTRHFMLSDFLLRILTYCLIAW